MCNICGAFNFSSKITKFKFDLVRNILNQIALDGNIRGSDSFGIFADIDNENKNSVYKGVGLYDNEIYNEQFNSVDFRCILIHNRAIPTTEMVLGQYFKTQPFFSNDKQCVCIHNGIVSNDKDLIQSYNLNPECSIDSAVIPEFYSKFSNLFFSSSLDGSFALAIYDYKKLVLLRNYKPLRLLRSDKLGVYIFSSYFSQLTLEDLIDNFDFKEIEFPPYTGYIISKNDKYLVQKNIEPIKSNQAVVLCSGGLDSAVTTHIACEKHGAHNVTLLYFVYDCNSQIPEISAVKNLANFYGCKYKKIDINLKQYDSSSNLFVKNSVEQGLSGAETPHEWVVARNTVFISNAAAYCDANNISSIYLGLNLEEAGVYKDNTVEFVELFNKLLKFGSQRMPEIYCPLQYSVKHEIVSVGIKLDVPLHLSFSCYDPIITEMSNTILCEPCNKCGSCYLREKAFEMNNITDPYIVKSAIVERK